MSKELPDIEKFLEGDDVPAKHIDKQTGVTDWLPFTTWEFGGGALQIVDLDFAGDDSMAPVAQAVPKATMRVEAKGFSDEDNQRQVAALRAVPDKVAASRGAHLGHAGVDTATVCVCDFERVKAYGDQDEDGFLEWLEEEEDALCEQCGVIKSSKAGISLPFVQSGYGDGSYPVIALEHDGKTVGLEVVFVGSELDEFPEVEDDDNASDTPKTERRGKTSSTTDDRTIAGLFNSRSEASQKDLIHEFKEDFDLRCIYRKNSPSWDFRIEHIEAPLWLSRHPFSNWTETAIKAGFRQLGTFQLDRNDWKLAEHVLSHPELNCCVLLRHIPEHFEVFSSTSDNCVKWISSYPGTEHIAYPDWIQAHPASTDSLSEALDQFLESHSPTQCLPIDLDRYSKLTTKIHRDLLAWQVERGGTTLAEHRRQVEAFGHLPTNASERTDFLNRIRRNDAEAHLCAWWKAQPDVPCPLGDAIEPLIIIHDDLRPCDLAQYYWHITGSFRFSDVSIPDGTAREAFARLAKENNLPIQKVAEKKTGFQADFYLPNK